MIEKINKVDTPRLIQLLNEYSNKLEEIVKNELNAENFVATGKLIKSIKTKVKRGKDTYEVIFSANDYFEYVENGRHSGKKTPVYAILKWVQAKKILPRPDEKGNIPTEKQLAYMISTAIGKNGTIKRKDYHGANILFNTVEELNDYYIPQLEDALKSDFHEAFIKVNESITGWSIY